MNSSWKSLAPNTLDVSKFSNSTFDANKFSHLDHKKSLDFFQICNKYGGYGDHVMTSGVRDPCSVYM